MDAIIYHNPACGTSCNTLGLICKAGIEPRPVSLAQSAKDSPSISRARRAAGFGER